MPDNNETAPELRERYLKTVGVKHNQFDTDHFRALIDRGKKEMIKDAVRALDYQMCEGCNPAPVWRR